MNKQKAIIDSLNAAYLQAPSEPRPNIKNISAVAEVVESSGLEPVIIIDPGIRPVISDVETFDKLLSDRRVTARPPDKEMNRFILETAEKFNALIVSNNTYAEYYEDFPWIEERRIAIAMVNGRVQLLDKLKRAS